MKKLLPSDAIIKPYDRNRISSFPYIRYDTALSPLPVKLKASLNLPPDLFQDEVNYSTILRGTLWCRFKSGNRHSLCCGRTRASDGMNRTYNSKDRDACSSHPVTDKMCAQL
ncbi:uncharacterized protein LOC111260057 isoform X2 [Varroa jacobsoni]|uniref:uncharacterized protein LOC111260057 isoform X2 n=1 Tax=Varroa jacobsoni TaxID=62625 RepID=UPI000BF954CD|nr:uncharacterized protein LOC111260057 isoform X2 [Varroa jacobsoni]